MTKRDHYSLLSTIPPNACADFLCGKKQNHIIMPLIFLTKPGLYFFFEFVCLLCVLNLEFDPVAARMPGSRRFTAFPTLSYTPIAPAAKGPRAQQREQKGENIGQFAWSARAQAVFCA